MTRPTLAATVLRTFLPTKDFEVSKRFCDALGFARSARDRPRGRAVAFHPEPGGPTLIRPATAADADALWAMLEPVIRAGETYALDRGMTREEGLAFWLAHEAFVAEEGGAVLGTYYLRRNQAGGGAHVCNCGYVVAAEASGRGVARAMAEHSFAEARERGYRGMQFNCVVSTNARAVRLWQALGFSEIGRVPGGFAHPRLGYVDALVMYRAL